MSIGVGLSVVLLGEPGDLAYTIQCVHDKAYVELSHMFPMVVASLFRYLFHLICFQVFHISFSIVGAGSLGPEGKVFTNNIV